MGVKAQEVLLEHPGSWAWTGPARVLLYALCSGLFPTPILPSNLQCLSADVHIFRVHLMVHLCGDGRARYQGPVPSCLRFSLKPTERIGEATFAAEVAETRRQELEVNHLRLVRASPHEVDFLNNFPWRFTSGNGHFLVLCGPMTTTALWLPHLGRWGTAVRGLCSMRSELESTRCSCSDPSIFL